MTVKHLVALASAALLAACAGAPAPEQPAGVSVHASFAFDPGSVALVTITAEPAGSVTSLIYDPATGQYVGAISLPAGPQSLTVQAFADENGDGELELVATGTTTVVVVEGQITAVMVRLVSIAPPPPVPDHAPIVTSFQVANANPAVGEEVAVSVEAVDVDGDAISFAWLVGCNTGTATVADPTAPVTTFSVDAPATCTVSVGVTANGKVGWAHLPVQIGGPGSAEISIGLAPQPFVTQVAIADGAGYSCTIDRAGSEATCGDPIAAGATVDVWVSVDVDSVDGLISLWTCGGSAATLMERDGGMARYSWTAPTTPGVCVLTGRVFRDGLVDALPVALQIL